MKVAPPHQIRVEKRFMKQKHKKQSLKLKLFSSLIHLQIISTQLVLCDFNLQMIDMNLMFNYLSDVTEMLLHR